MQKLIKSFYKSSLVTSIILLVVGLLLLFKSDDTIIALSYIIAGILLVLGIIAVINFFRESSMNPFNDLNIVYGIVTIILGILIISNPMAIATVIPFVVGLVILISSSIKLAYSIELKDNEDEVWKPTLIMAAISSLCGILILFNPFKTSVIVFKIIGIFIIVYAILDIISIYQIKRSFKTIKNDLEKIEDVTIEAEVIEEKESSEAKPEEKSKSESKTKTRKRRKNNKTKENNKKDKENNTKDK